jgi:hypothetical protein
MTDTGLTGQQLAQLNKVQREHLAAIFANIEHRQYAIEQARKLIAGTTQCTPAQFIELATAIHGFIVQPAAASTTSPPATMTAMASTETA